MTKKQIKKYIEEILYFLDKDSKKIIVLCFGKKCKRTGVFTDEKGIYYLEIGEDLFRECKKNKINSEKIIQYIICHEYGHIYHDTNYETYKEKVDSEYQAERYGLNKLKKYFPEAYKWAILERRRVLKDKKWGKSKREKHYRTAWNRIKEYNPKRKRK